MSNIVSNTKLIEKILSTNKKNYILHYLLISYN